MGVSILSTTRSGHNFIADVIKSWLPNEEIRLLENTLPEHIYQYNLKVGKKVIVIRDFPNFLASCLKGYLDYHGENSQYQISIDRKISVYKAILEEAMNPTYYNADVVISYQYFCKSRRYRKEICEILGGKYTEDMLGTVSAEGYGSSFDGLTYQGNGQEMETSKRAEQILETEWATIYEQVLKDNLDAADLWVEWKKQR